MLLDSATVWWLACSLRSVVPLAMNVFLPMFFPEALDNQTMKLTSLAGLRSELILSSVSCDSTKASIQMKTHCLLNPLVFSVLSCMPLVM